MTLLKKSSSFEQLFSGNQLGSGNAGRVQALHINILVGTHIPGQFFIMTIRILILAFQ
jgi:hypothetical protein